MNAKLAGLLDLAADATWSASFSDRQDHIGVYARSALLPGAAGLQFDLRTPQTWRCSPSTSSLSAEQAEFWQRFSVRPHDPFGGFEVTTADLAAVVPPDRFAVVLDGLRVIAARHEAAAMADVAVARECRAVVRGYDRSWACPDPVAPEQFEDPGHRVRVERLRGQDGWRPADCWVVRQVAGTRPRPWPMQGWWATRRGADDQARRVLAGQDPC